MHDRLLQDDRLEPSGGFEGPGPGGELGDEGPVVDVVDVVDVVEPCSTGLPPPKRAH